MRASAIRAVCLAAAVGLAGFARAAEPTPPDAGSPATVEDPECSGEVPVRALPALFASDTLHTLDAPLHWDGTDFLRAGVAAAAVVSTATWLDGPVRDRVQRSHSGSLDSLTKVIEPFGAGASFATLGAFGLAGVVFHDAKARSVAVDGLAASLISAGIVAPALKFAVGRTRPYQDGIVGHFEPFGGGGSFPSGHAAEAFAVASVISAHYHEWWVWTAAYGTAALVGFSRIYHDAHWTSDVLAGAVVGTAVGWRVVNLNSRPARPGGTVAVSLAPVVGHRAYGLTVGLELK